MIIQVLNARLFLAILGFKTRSSDVYSMVPFIEEKIEKVLIFLYVQIVQVFF